MEGPAVIGSRFTSSLSPKALLRQHLESWRGRPFTEQELMGFDLINLLGVPALISVMHSEDGKFANISAIMGMPPGGVEIKPEGELLLYDPNDAGALAVWNKLSEGFQKAIIRGNAAPEGVQAQIPQQPAQPPALPPAAQPAPPGAAPAHQVAPHGPMHSPTDVPFDDDIPFAFVLPTVLGLGIAAQQIVPLVA